MPGALTRWEPFAELGELRRIFDETFRDGERAWMPAIDVVRDDGNLLVRADIPGIKPEEKKEEKDKQYLRRERRYGSFSRSMALPPGVEAKKIKANTHDGIVEVTIPLPKEPEKGKVEIKPTAA